MSEPFNALRARAKRPCPLWVDAFLRDTTHLEADEVGAYMLLLMAMWIRESCDLPDDDARLSRVARVSLRLWKSRVGPVIRPLLTTGDGTVFSKRLREEATYVERQVQQQSDRKKAEKSDKLLKDNKLGQSADASTDKPRDYPSYNLQPNIREEDDDDESREVVSDPPKVVEKKPEISFFDRVLIAANFNPRDVLPSRWMPPGAEIEVNRWRDLDGLTEDLILQHITESRKRHTECPSSPKAFEFGLRNLARTIASPPPEPLPPSATLPPARGGAPPLHRVITSEERLAAMRAALPPEREKNP